MKSEVIGKDTIASARPATIAASTASQDVMMRNFVLQQGFPDPPSALRRRQYAALTFQPRIVLILVIAGILFRAAK